MNTLLKTETIPRMGRKKVDRWRHRAELVNQGATLVLDVFVLQWWMTARCTMLSSGAAIKQGNCSCVRRICFILTSLETGLPWLTDSSLYGGERLKGQNQLLKLWDYHPQFHWEEMVSMLVWIARALQPIAARGFTHWRLSRYIDGFLGCVKCSPGPISKPIDFALQNPSRAHGFIGKEKHRLHAPIVPKCKPMKSRIKGRCHRSSLKRRDSTAYPTSVWFPSCPNQWCNRTVAASWHRLR